MKQKIEIEVDVPDGYEATGEHLACGVGYPDGQDRAISGYIILRKKWDAAAWAREHWPKWLKAAAIAKEADGRWFFHQETSRQSANRLGWTSHGRMVLLERWMLDIDLPDVPWDQSLILNPHRSTSCAT